MREYKDGRVDHTQSRLCLWLLGSPPDQIHIIQFAWDPTIKCDESPAKELGIIARLKKNANK